MSVKLKIKVTKEILEQSKGCRKTADVQITNCAVALAIRDIFPEARVWAKFIYPIKGTSPSIMLPDVASNFIYKFDTVPNEDRSNLPEIEFEIEIPDEVIEKINIEELRPLLIGHKNLELIS